MGLPGDSDSKESVCDVGDLGLIPGLGRSPGGGHGNWLQYSCLENPMDRGAWRATVHGISKSGIWLSDQPQHSIWVKRIKEAWYITEFLLLEALLMNVVFTSTWWHRVRHNWTTELMDYRTAGLLYPWDSPGKNTGVSCHALLQGIFPTQGP